MYWGQAITAAATGSGAAYLAYTRYGLSLVTAVTVAVGVYVLLRPLFATVGRTRHWLRRGTRGAYWQRCGDCGQQVYRMSGDWILRCHRCGWTKGWPVLRWARYSVPARQFRRSISWSHIVVVVLAVAAVGIAPAIGSVPVADAGGAGTTTAAPTTESATPQPATTTTTTQSDNNRINVEKTERLVFEYVNERRSERGMVPYSSDERAAEAAKEHAEHMARNNYFSHTEPNGETQRERYAFCSGGENAAQTWVFQEIRQDRGIVYYSTAEELASGIVIQWMNSEPHRERGVYGEWWQSAGVGVAITDGGKVYAVMGFCT